MSFLNSESNKMYLLILNDTLQSTTDVKSNQKVVLSEDSFRVQPESGMHRNECHSENYRLNVSGSGDK